MAPASIKRTIADDESLAEIAVPLAAPHIIKKLFRVHTRLCKPKDGLHLSMNMNVLFLQSVEFLGIVTGNPRVSQGLPVPVPVSAGTGTGTGLPAGFSLKSINIIKINYLIILIISKLLLCEGGNVGGETSPPPSCVSSKGGREGVWVVGGETAPPPSCVSSKGGSGVFGEDSSPLRLAFRAREGGSGVVVGETAPSVLRFEQGREGVWVVGGETTPPLSCVSSKGGREWGGWRKKLPLRLAF